jgi:predicted acylesterase/phospholipase RssA
MPTRALITSGGGAKGAFTVGALNALADIGINKYDIISGTSTGALLAALSVLGKFSELEDIYLSVNNDDILKKQNIADNILNDRPFIYDTDPLLEMITTHITDDTFNQIMASPTILCLTSISLQTGKISVFCTKDIPSTEKYTVSPITTRQRLIDALLASSSQAGFVRPISIDAGNGIEQFVDGGNRDVIPSRVVTDLNPDEIYVLSNNPSVLFRGDDDYSHTSVVNVILRAISIFIQDVRENDLAVLEEFAKEPNKKVFRIEPTQDLDPAHATGLNFNPITMTVWMGMGRNRVNTIVPDRPLRPF